MLTATQVANRALFLDRVIAFLKERKDPRLVETTGGDAFVGDIGRACADFCAYMDQHPELSTPDLMAGAEVVADELAAHEMGEAAPGVH